MKYVYGKKIKTLRDRLTTGIAALALLANTAGMSLPFILAQHTAAAASSTVHSTDLSAWDLTSTSEDGSAHNEITSTGLHVWTEATGIRKAAGYYATNFDLDNAADWQLDWTGSVNQPGGQLVVDLDNDGDTDGILVVENIYGGISGKIWLPSLWNADTTNAGLVGLIPHETPAAGSGNYANQGDLSTWNINFPDAKVKAIGYSIGSGITGNGTITKITVNDTDYTFGLPTPDPELVNIDVYYRKDTFKGIGVDIRVNHLSDATGVEVKVDRSNGGPVIKTNKSTGSVLSVLNTGSLASVTAPIVIQQGSYDEAGSSSWNQPTATWDSTTVPTSVTVTITREGGAAPLVMTRDVSQIGTSKATLAEVMPVDTSAPTFSIVSPANGSTKSGIITIEAEVVDPSNITKLLLNVAGKSHSWNNGVSSTITRTGNIFSLTLDTTTLPDGPVWVVLRGTDGAGNTRYWNNNASNRQHVFYIDNTGPGVLSATINGENADIAPRTANCGPTAFNLVGGDINLAAIINDGSGSGVQSASYRIIKVNSGGCIMSNPAVDYGGGVYGYRSGNFAMTNTSGNEWTGLEFDTTTLPEDGRYTIAITARDSNGNETTRYVDITVDNTTPTAPTITAPGARTWHRTAPIVNSWTAATDDNGIAYYQIAYNYDDGHTFSASTCPGLTIPGASGFIGCRDVNDLSRNHSPNTNEQGGVTIWVRAIDNAGNVGPWSRSVHYYYDNEAPETTLTVSPVVNGIFTVSGSAKDNLALNRVYVQLVYRDTSERCGGTTINLIPEGDTANWSRTYDISTLGCPEGEYAAHVSVVDMAGNTSSQGWTENFLVVAPEETAAPTVPTVTYLEDDTDGLPRVSGDNTYIRDFIFTLTGSENTTRYQLRYWNDIESSPFKIGTPWNPTDGSWSGHMGPLGTYTDLFTQGYGTHYFAFSACDAEGNCSAYSEPFVITYLPDDGIGVGGCTTNELCCDFDDSNDPFSLSVFAVLDVDGECDNPADNSGNSQNKDGNDDSSNNTAPKVLGDSVNANLTNTGTQNGGLIVFAAAGLMAIALLTLRRKQEN